MKKKLMALLLLLTAVAATGCGSGHGTDESDSSKSNGSEINYNMEDSETSSLDVTQDQSEIQSQDSEGSLAQEDSTGASSQEDNSADSESTLITYTDTAQTVDEDALITGYQLEEIGTVNNLTDYYPFASSGELQFVSAANVSEEKYTYCDDLSDGYYQVCNAEYLLNAVGLMSADGELILSCEASLYDWIDGFGAGNRFLKVYYATEETDDEDEALLYSYASDGFIIPLGPSDEDTLYKGYLRIYDTQEKQFVGDITVTDSSTKIYACGSAVVIVDSSDAVMYDLNGNKLVESSRSNYRSVGNGYMILRDDDYQVYDENGTLTYTSQNALNYVDSTSGYLMETDENDCVYIIDIYGNIIVTIGTNCNNVLRERYGTILISKGSDTSSKNYQLINLNGEIVAEADQSLTCAAPGYWYVHYSNGYALYGPNGLIADGIDSGNKVPYGCIQNDDYSVVVLSETDSLIETTGTASQLTFGLAVLKNDNGYVLYDLITGTQLTDYGDYNYYGYKYKNGYIYMPDSKNTTWTVYKVIELHS